MPIWFLFATRCTLKGCKDFLARFQRAQPHKIRKPGVSRSALHTRLPSLHPFGVLMFAS